MAELPIGTVTFLFTDVEGSTALWERDPAQAADLFRRHDDVIEQAVARCGGTIVRPRGEGDSRFAVFAVAHDALRAACEMQLGFIREAWAAPLRVRVGIHTGQADVRDADYYGVEVNRCARLRAIASGGQVLVSEHAVAATVELPEGASLRDLGTHRLRDLSTPMRVFQLCHPELPSEFPPLTSLEHVPNNLPAQLTPFIGRESEISEIRGMLDSTRLLTLTGAGGAGKTRLALHVAADLIHRYEGGAWLVDLATVADARLVEAAIATVLGATEEAGRSIQDAIVDALRARGPVLLVLDNCEHVIGSTAPAAERILRACPDVTILATSREPLGVAGELPWRVPSLTAPDPDRPHDEASVLAYEAVRFFIDRAQRVDPGFGLTSDNAASVARLCARLDGIPLALELAAARLEVLTVQQIEQKLDDRFRLLTGGARTSMERQQTLRAAVDWSYEMLGPDEQRLLQRLSVFAGPFSLEAAEEVCGVEPLSAGAVLDLVTSLVRRSLLIGEKHGGAGYFRMLETIRQYCREKLLSSGEGGLMRSRHRDHYRGLVARAAPSLTGPDQVQWLETLDRARDNLRAALSWSVADPDTADGALEMCHGLYLYWHARGPWSEGRRWIEQALEHGRSPQACARAIAAAAGLANAQQDLVAAAALAEDAVARAERMGDDVTLTLALAIAAGVWRVRGDMQRARTTADRLVEVAERIGDQHHLAAAYSHLAFLAGAGEQQRRSLRRAVEVARAAGDIRMVAIQLYNLGAVDVTVGDFASARRSLEEAGAALHRLGDDRYLLVASLMLEGQAALFQGDWDVAAQRFERALAIERTAAEPGSQLRARFGEALLFYVNGDLSRARDAMTSALHEMQRTGALPNAANALVLIGHISWLLGDLPAAKDALARASLLAEELGLTLMQGQCLTTKADVDRATGASGSARDRYREALDIFERLGARLGILNALTGLAQVATLDGDHATGGVLFGAVEAARRALDARLWPTMRDDLERSIAACKEALGARAFDAAFADGARMSLEEAVARARALDVSRYHRVPDPEGERR